MYIKELPLTAPRYVEGRKFTEKTMVGRYRGTDIQIKTTYMNDRPLLKQYIFENTQYLKNVWKSMKKGFVTEEMTLDKNLNVII